jgi:glycosyltransferase involved in cell wall biosynthesis
MTSMNMKDRDIRLSVVIIAKNEEIKIQECLKSVSWADEIILVDSGSTDNTIAIAKKMHAVIVNTKKQSYSEWRNIGLQKARGQWILYIDADERVPHELRDEIQEIVENRHAGLHTLVAFAIPRKNFVFGKEMRYGGLWPDYQKRFFRKSHLLGYSGNLHEEAQYKGDLGHLSSWILHIKHDNIFDMVEKTNRWSVIEAKLLLDADHPSMSWWRFIRIMLTELWVRVVREQGFRDGPEGIIYSIYQMWSKFITYAKLWEMQNNQNIKADVNT